ncbi:T6SS amidase immunity protein Tai4 family protein, partial [Caldimonas brevitalea]|uniref:Uncharacterized protein n=1 Tax=Caldimonas brevitalea TaxID=413882 RepID=A0A0G3BRC1_9BURK
MKPKLLTVVLCGALAGIASAKDRPVDSPESAGRAYAEVYKDMVLALCVAKAYQKEPGAAADAGSTVGAL